jgi:hypothetical protein
LGGALFHKPEGSGSNQDDGFFILLKPSSRTVALGLIQSQIEMSVRNFPGYKVQPARKAENLTAICEPVD